MCKFIVLIMLSSTLCQFIDSSNNWRFCPPCRCFGDKRADCSQEKMNVTLTNIPDFLSNEIEVLNITKHTLKTLEDDIFFTVNLTNLWKVYLDKCAIKTIEKHAFRYLEQMTDLSLMNNEITVLDAELFSTNTNLKYIWLDNNRIKKLPSKLFSELLYLSGFYARFNLIEVVENIFTDHPDLWIIDLSNNKLQYLNATMINNLKYLKVLFLHENMWSCDCRMQYLHQIMLNKNLYNLTKTVCTYPHSMKGKELKLFQTNEFKCWQNISPIPSGNLTFYEYTNTTFSCEVDALPTPEITWLHNNKTINGTKYILSSSTDTVNDTVTHHYITILNMLSNDTGVYSCKVNHPVYGITYQNINLTVLEITRPSVSIIRNYSDIQSEVENYTMSCIISGIPKPDMYWTHDTNMIASTNNNFILTEEKMEDKYCINVTIKNLNYNNKGQYTCHAKYAKFISSHSVDLSVPAPYIPEVQISSESLFKEATNATLFCFVKSYSVPSITWEYNNKICSNSPKYKMNGSNINNIYWYNITIINITVEDRGVYKCATSSKEGSTEKTFHLKTILFIPKMIMYSPTVAFENTDVLISCYVTTYPFANILWKFNSTYLTSSLKYNITMTHVSETSYWSNLSITNITQMDAGLYNCHANNSEGYIEQTTSLLVLESEFKTYWLWYLIIILIIIGILSLIIITVFLLLIKKSNLKQKADISGEEKNVKEDTQMTEIPLNTWPENDPSCMNHTKEDIMYIMDRELKSYNVTRSEN